MFTILAKCLYSCLLTCLLWEKGIPCKLSKQISKLFFQMSTQVFSVTGQTGNFQNKSVSSSFSWVSRYILFLPKLKGRGRLFSRGARRETALWDYPQEYLVVIRDEKVSLFVKFEIILPLLCFLLTTLQISTVGHGVLW